MFIHVEKIGEYLVKHTMEVSGGYFGKCDRKQGAVICQRALQSPLFGGELWSLGDSVCVGLMMNNTLGKFHMEKAPDELDNGGFYEWSGRKRKGNTCFMTRSITDFIIQDMFEKVPVLFLEKTR